MNKLETIVGVLIGVNILLSVFNHNWHSLVGWFVAGLEWARRLYCSDWRPHGDVFVGFPQPSQQANGVDQVTEAKNCDLCGQLIIGGGVCNCSYVPPCEHKTRLFPGSNICYDCGSVIELPENQYYARRHI